MTKTYAQLSREIASLQATAEKLRAAEIKAAVAKANELIATYGLTANDLKFSKSTSSPSVPAAARAVASDARYSDGKGNTWGGRGPRPAWLKDALAAGQALQSFETGTSSLPSTKKRNTGTKSGFKVAIKYRDAATGNSWSGRGSQPAWLKAALKKRGSKISDYLVDSKASSAASSTTNSTPAKAATKKVAKTSARKVVAARGAQASATLESPIGARKSATATPSLKTAGLKRSAASKPAAKPRLSKKQGSGAADPVTGATVDRLPAPNGSDLTA